jgi:hypothetical protein
VAQRSDELTARNGSETSIAEVVELVTTYAKQETVEPIKNAGRFLGTGLAAAGLLGIGLSLVLLGLLRLLQTEVERLATGSLSWIAYLIVLVVCAGVIVLTLSRISRTGLDDSSKVSNREIS